MTPKQRIKIALTHWLSTHRRSPITRGGSRAARVFLEMAGNHNYECDSNGESWLLERLGHGGPHCVFDVGANVGDWTSEVLRLIPGAVVHAFELVPATARALAARYEDEPRVTANAVGLSDRSGVVQVKHYPEFPAASALVDFPHPLEHVWLNAEVTTGDEYCERFGIQHVDLLKIDAEGADHRVLRGFTRLLTARAVDVIQFEYGRAAITNRFLLRDFYDLLQDYDMILGKLYPDGVDFRDYDIGQDEDFLGPNFVAVQKERFDLVQLLGGEAKG